MAYSVNWLTKVVTIPKADLTQISASPEIYQLDVLEFWAEVHALQQDDGITYDPIMSSNAPVTLSGQTYARSVEIINGYQIAFENGSYQVNLVGANNNIVDVRVPNSVSLVGNNSAGAVVVAAGSGLSTQQALMLSELWKRLGLDPLNPLTSTQSQITVDDIVIDLTGDGVNTSVATRQ